MKHREHPQESQQNLPHSKFGLLAFVMVLIGIPLFPIGFLHYGFESWILKVAQWISGIGFVIGALALKEKNKRTTFAKAAVATGIGAFVAIVVWFVVFTIIQLNYAANWQPSD